jgi:hypothetical protein
MGTEEGFTFEDQDILWIENQTENVLTALHRVIYCSLLLFFWVKKFIIDHVISSQVFSNSSN